VWIPATALKAIILGSGSQPVRTLAKLFIGRNRIVRGKHAHGCTKDRSNGDQVPSTHQQRSLSPACPWVFVALGGHPRGQEPTGLLCCEPSPLVAAPQATSCLNWPGWCWPTRANAWPQWPPSVLCLAFVGPKLTNMAHPPAPCWHTCPQCGGLPCPHTLPRPATSLSSSSGVFLK